MSRSSSNGVWLDSRLTEVRVVHVSNAAGGKQLPLQYGALARVDDVETAR